MNQSYSEEMTLSLVDRTVERYLNSDDFNGLNLDSFRSPASRDIVAEKTWLGSRIERDLVTLRLETSGNPYIRHFPDPDKETQLKELLESPLSCVVVYPTAAVLATRVDQSRYADRPFTLRLALGEAQLDFHSFDLSVLEYYRNDPRFYYRVDDVFGSIWMQDEHSGERTTEERDQTYLKTFGFSYDDDMNRSVLVFTRYLADLSPEHQRIWEAQRLKERGKMHPDYYRSSIRGIWADHIPILTALTLELKHINAMCMVIGKPPLFRESYHEERPRGFNLLIRPTAKEFNDFVMLLDQVLSDNINKDFFRDDTDLEEEIERDDGRIEVRQRGTLALLEDWIRRHFVPNDPAPLDRAFTALRHVRKLRQKPAHKPVDGKFDQQFFKDQRQLIIEAHGAVRLIRLVLKNHPKCADYKVESYLEEGRIRER